MARKAVLRGGALVGIAVMTTGAWIAGKQVRSPAQAAATANPPTASRITAPVENRMLSSSVIVRGVVRYGDPRAVVLASSSLKATASGSSAGQTAIVSNPAEKGAELPEGATALSVGGRPVFVFQGKVPAYRDLRPGDIGEDVKQLEQALARLGQSPGAADGRFDNATERAVERWYRAKGYNAFGPTEAQRTQLRGLRDSLSRAEDAVITATQSLDAAKCANSADKLVAAKETVRTSREKVETVLSDHARDEVRFDAELAARESAIVLAQQAIVVAEAALAKTQRDVADTAVVVDSQDAVVTAQAQAGVAAAALDEAKAQLPLVDAAVGDAAATLEAAKKDLDLLKTTKVTIPQADPNVIVVTDNSPATIRAAEGVVRQAEAALRTAEANRTAAVRAIESRKAAVTEAERAVARAQLAVERAGRAVSDRGSLVTEATQRVATANADLERVTRERDASQRARDDARRAHEVTLRQARGAVTVAEAQLRDARNPGGITGAVAQLRSAEATKARAAAEIREIEAQIGIVVPANELLFFPSLPLRVDDVKALRGDVVTGPVMTVTTSRLAVDSSVDVAEAKLVRVGSAVVIESTEFNVTLNGTVTEIATTAGTKGVDSGKVYLEVTPNEGEQTDVDPKNLNGSSVKLTIPIRSTDAEVLAVPVAAVSVGANGASRVEVEDSPDRPTRFVEVKTGLSAEGFVEIRAVGAELTEGAQVVIGNREGSLLEGEVEANDESSDTRSPESSDAPSSESDPPADTSGASETSATPESETSSSGSDLSDPDLSDTVPS